MAPLTVYEKHRCSTCRQLRELLDEQGVAYTLVEYHDAGFTEAELRGLLRKSGLGPREILRTREPQVAALGLPGERSDDELIALMLVHPGLVQRPIVVAGDRAVLARPISRALELV